MTVKSICDPQDHAPKRRPDRPASMGGVLRDPTQPRIRFGLGGVKGIGTAALEAVFESRVDEHGNEQPFTDLFDFCSRVDLRRVNKGVIEALVQCGAFDKAHEAMAVSRAQAFAAIEAALERGKRASQDRLSGQISLFGLFDSGAKAGSEKSVERTSAAAYPNIPPWDLRELLSREKNALGFYVSGHPLDRYKTELVRFGNATTDSLGGGNDGADIRIGGTVEGLRERPTKSGGKIGFFSLEDAEGRIEVIVRDRELEAFREILVSGEPVFIEAKLRFERDENGEENQAAEPKLQLKGAKLLSTALREKTKSVRVKIPVERVDTHKLRALRDALRAAPGPCPVSMELASDERWSVTVMELGVSIEPSDALMAQVERLFGEKILELR
jgi:DNA polymerase III subunit alpha